MSRSEFAETRAVARLPHLDVEMVHRRPWEGEGEHLSVSLRALPSFEAFASCLHPYNPLTAWVELMRAAWAPWLGGIAAMTQSLRAIAEAGEGYSA